MDTVPRFAESRAAVAKNLGAAVQDHNKKPIQFGHKRGRSISMVDLAAASEPKIPSGSSQLVHSQSGFFDRRPASTLNPQQTGVYALALRDYTSTDSDRFSIKANDRVEILKHEDNWVLVTRVTNGISGWVPPDCLQQEFPFRALAMYDYTPREANEMKLVANERLTILEEVEPGWYLAKFDSGVTGSVPANYVKREEEEVTQKLNVLGSLAAFEQKLKLTAPGSKPTVAVPRPTPAIAPKILPPLQKVNSQASCLYDFQGSQPGELSVKQHDKVEILATDGPWCHVKKLSDNSIGYVPSAYVRNLSPIPSRPPPKLAPNPEPHRTPIPLPKPPKSPVAETTTNKKGVGLYDYNSGQTDDLPLTASDVVEILNKEGEWYRVKRMSDGALGLVPCNYIEIIPNRQPDPTEPQNALKKKWENTVGLARAQGCANWKFQVACFELIDSWKTFVEELGNLQRDIIDPLGRSCQLPSHERILSEAEFLDIFGNIADVHRVAKKLNNELQQKFKDSNYIIKTIGQLLETNFEEFHVFASYCSTLHTALLVVAKISSENVDFVSFLEKSKTNSMNFSTLLSKPFTLVLKFPLLLKAMIETLETETDQTETWALKAAKATIEDVLLRVNLVQRVVQDIKATSQADLVDPFFLSTSRRKLLFCGQLSVSRANNAAIDTFTLLYKDCLVVCVLDTTMWPFSRTNQHYKLVFPPVFLELLTVGEMNRNSFQITSALSTDVFNVSTAENKAIVQWQRQIINAKQYLTSSAVLRLNRVTLSPPSTSVNACLVIPNPDHDGTNMFMMGTQQGLFVRSANKPAWINVPGMPQRIMQLGIFGTFFIVLEKQSNTVVYYPIEALTTKLLSNAVKGRTLEQSKNAMAFQVNYSGSVPELSVLTSNQILVYHLDGPAENIIKIAQYAVAQCVTFYMHHTFAIAGTDKFFKIARDSLKVSDVGLPTDLPSSKLIRAVSIDHQHILICYPNVGFLFDLKLDAPILTVYWMKATSFNYSAPYLLIAHAEENHHQYVEIRDIDRLWAIKQIIPCKSPLLWQFVDNLVLMNDPVETNQRVLQQFLPII